MSSYFGLWASFSNKELFIEALKTLRDQGYSYVETASSQDLEEVDDYLPFASKKSILPLATLLGALLGLCLGFGMQWYCMAYSTPLNIGGRPLFSWPSFIPITFVLTILCAALTLVITFLWKVALPCLSHPVFFIEKFDLSQGHFDIVISSADPQFDPSQTRHLLLSLRAQDVEDIPWS